MIKFLQETTLAIVDEYDKTTDTIIGESIQTFKSDEPIDAEICSVDGLYVDLQFGYGGGVASGVTRSWFEVIPDTSRK